MKTTKGIINTFCVLLTVFIFSCKKENKTNSTTTTATATSVQQDQTNLQTTMSSAGDEAVAMLNTQGAKSLSSLTNVLDKSPAFGKRESNLHNQINSKVRTAVYGVRNVLHWKRKHTAKRTESNHFDFNGSTGTYTWNAAQEQWTKELGNPNNKVVLLFPSDSNGTTNNAKLTISAYTEQFISELSDGYDSTFVPTQLTADLYIDNVKQSSVEFTGSYNSNGIPIALNLNLFANPYTVTVAFSNLQTSVTGNLKVTKTGESVTIVGLNATIAFMNSSQEELKTVTGDVTFKDMNVSGNINIEGLNALSDTSDVTPEQLNSNISMALSYKGAVIGNLLFVVGDVGQNIASIKFKDGTYKPAEDYFQTLIDDVEKEFEKLGLS